MDDPRSTRKLDGENLSKVLQDGLVGRRALLRAYESVSERTNDPQLKEKLAAFANEERNEYERAAEITRAHGGDPGAVHNVKEEVASFLSKTLFRGGAEPYATARDIAMLHGLEASGHAGAIFLKQVAQTKQEQDWVQAIDASIHRAQDHMQFLQQQAEVLGQRAAND